MCLSVGFLSQESFAIWGSCSQGGRFPWFPGYIGHLFKSCSYACWPVINPSIRWFNQGTNCSLLPSPARGSHGLNTISRDIGFIAIGVLDYIPTHFSLTSCAIAPTGARCFRKGFFGAVQVFDSYFHDSPSNSLIVMLQLLRLQLLQ